MEALETEKILKEIKKIQEKMNNAPALNGEFISLSEKVDKIHIEQECQGKDFLYMKEFHKKVAKDVTQIKESLHSPQVGLFSQIEQSQSFHRNCKAQVIKDFDEMFDAIDLHEKKFDELEEKSIKPNFETLTTHEEQIKEIKKIQDSMSTVIKSSVAFVIMTTIGIIGTLLMILIN